MQSLKCPLNFREVGPPLRILCIQGTETRYKYYIMRISFLKYISHYPENNTPNVNQCEGFERYNILFEMISIHKSENPAHILNILLYCITAYNKSTKKYTFLAHMNLCWNTFLVGHPQNFAETSLFSCFHSSYFSNLNERTL